MRSIVGLPEDKTQEDTAEKLREAWYQPKNCEQKLRAEEIKEKKRFSWNIEGVTRNNDQALEQLQVKEIPRLVAKEERERERGVAREGVKGKLRGVGGGDMR